MLELLINPIVLILQIIGKLSFKFVDILAGLLPES
jgi:hypothetical protein